MDFIEKLAVFDLDGTVWKRNSHLFILNNYYGTYFYTSFCGKLISFLFPKIWKKKIDYDFSLIPDNYIEKIDILSFILNNDIVALLQEKKRDFTVIFLSSAPSAIIKKASDYFSISGFHADIGKKGMFLKENFEYKKLFVCTDNSTDKDLLNIADEKLFLGN